MDLAALRRWWPLAAVVGLLCAAALAATRSTPQLERIPPRVDVAPTLDPGPPGEIPPSAAGGSPPAVGGGLPESAGTVALIVLGVGIAVLLVVVGWAVARDLMRRRGARTVRRRTPVPATRTAEDLVAALDAGLSDLDDADLDPRRAVIACWVRLEQAAAAAGTPRHPGDTPTDLVARLLAEQQVDASVLAAFAGVYREARYATHTVDARMRAGAREALQRLRADLAGADLAGADVTGADHTGGDPTGGMRAGGGAVSRRVERRSDAGIDDLLGFDDGPAAVEEDARPVSRVGWLVRNALLVGAATAGTVGALRIVGAKLPVLLVLAGFVALRWLMIVLDDVAPPALPRAHRGGTGRSGSGESAVDGLREAVRRWEARLDRAQGGGTGDSSNLLATFAELTDERLRLRHGITRTSDPQRARELLGEPLWRLLAAPDGRPPKARDLAIHVQTLEDL